MADNDDEPLEIYCPICGDVMECVECPDCGGEGFDGHDCGDDCCACADPELNVPCQTCSGSGDYLECSRLPHTDAEMAAWRAKGRAT